MKQLILNEIIRFLEVKQLVFENAEIIDNSEILINDCIWSLKLGGKIIFCGNRCSFADSKHLAAEFVA